MAGNFGGGIFWNKPHSNRAKEIANDAEEQRPVKSNGYAHSNDIGDTVLKSAENK